MNPFKRKFEDAELDMLLGRFMKKTLDPASQRELMEALSTDQKFRESFADWINSSRNQRDWPKTLPTPIKKG